MYHTWRLSHLILIKPQTNGKQDLDNGSEAPSKNCHYASMFSISLKCWREKHHRYSHMRAACRLGYLFFGSSMDDKSFCLNQESSLLPVTFFFVFLHRIVCYMDWFFPSVQRRYSLWLFIWEQAQKRTQRTSKCKF